MLLKLKWMFKQSKLYLIFVLLFVLTLSFIFLNAFVFNPVPTYSSSYSAFDKMLSTPEQGSVVISGLSQNTCFWVTPSHNGTNYILVIREYNSPTKDCTGEMINKTEIVIDQPVIINGDTSCICGGKQYLIEKLSEGNLMDFKISIK
jgi:hypothetical protein